MLWRIPNKPSTCGTNHVLQRSRHVQGPSQLLDLPPELRNQIYELVSTSPGSGEEVELKEARPPPSPNTLLTCKQIRDEAQGLYDDARDQYLQTVFFVENVTGDMAAAYTANLLDASIQHIKYLTLIAPSFHGLQAEFEAGIWTSLNERRQRYVILATEKQEADCMALLERNKAADFHWVNHAELKIRVVVSLENEKAVEAVEEFARGKGLSVNEVYAAMRYFFRSQRR